MATRQNFTPAQRHSAFRCNALWLRDHGVSGVLIAQTHEHLRRAGLVHYCENCLFCHTDQRFFDIDHLVPDRQFRAWHAPERSPCAVNMLVLCKSLRQGDLGCNQSKGASLWVPRRRGLAISRADADLNCFPIAERPFDWQS